MQTKDSLTSVMSLLELGLKGLLDPGLETWTSFSLRGLLFPGLEILDDLLLFPSTS